MKCSSCKQEGHNKLSCKSVDRPLLAPMIAVPQIPNRILLQLAQLTSQILLTKQKELLALKWTDGEANTESGFSALACDCCKEAWNQIKNHYEEYNNTVIEVKSPDISILLTKEEKDLAKGKIELKSGKGDNIPGSTISSLDLNQPVIYCKRNNLSKPYEIRYAQYHGTIGESDYDLFQDRTPRPHVNFQKMSSPDETLLYVEKERTNWVEHYANSALNRVDNSKLCSYSWQDDLIKYVIKKFVRGTSVEDFLKMKNSYS